MGVSITHSKVSGVSDGGDTSKVRPSDWNADHVFVGPASDNVVLTSGNLTTSSSSFVDATGLSVTMTTGARRCLLLFNATVANSAGNGGYTAVDIAVDGTRIGASSDYGLALAHGVMQDAPVTIAVLTSTLSAGSHTFQVKFRAVSGTSTIYASTSGGVAATFGVQELL